MSTRTSFNTVSLTLDSLLPLLSSSCIVPLPHLFPSFAMVIGCPLSNLLMVLGKVVHSQYLFILCMEKPSMSTCGVVNNDTWHPIQIEKNALNISHHLLYSHTPTICDEINNLRPHFNLNTEDTFFGQITSTVFTWFFLALEETWSRCNTLFTILDLTPSTYGKK